LVSVVMMCGWWSVKREDRPKAAPT
jgi:hypothetical protein